MRERNRILTRLCEPTFGTLTKRYDYNVYSISFSSFIAKM